MLSKTCEYALRAMIYLAQHSKDGNMVNIKEISENIDSPELFIGKILQGLSKKGFLQSSKGRYGGFYVNEENAKASLADIIIAIDGDKIFKGCGVGLNYCSEKNPCPIHHEYKHTRRELYNIYKKANLNQFKSGLENAKLFLKRQ
ncbi:RrF2 family transcriptional regulator [Haoranjiania flava]|uniref:Rrf2 family transcriptional regulator n=1 Tax=Haoranjiania flava TaxID=1856322 RepID=A0AAE3LNI4_9BACT|nr:Rrf2 family transcriptional regulator [Haoranjiania flava]MCU7695066.1 Rrf2 family transcriptional regulator [Haoranjiania flava]